jgi:hypothetical protein
MYTSAFTIPVNPPGTVHALTRDLVWRGLVMKAENALPFVPVMQACDVIERFDHGLVRTIRIADEELIERVTFTPEVQVLFERLDAAGARTGWIANILSEDATGLLLTFVIHVLAPKAPPADMERFGAAMKQRYIEAIATTLSTTRALASAGTLP